MTISKETKPLYQNEAFTVERETKRDKDCN